MLFALKLKIVIFHGKSKNRMKSIGKKKLLRFKTLTLSLCVLAFNGVIFAQPVLVKSQQEIQEYQLDNGLKVISTSILALALLFARIKFPSISKYGALLTK